MEDWHEHPDFNGQWHKAVWVRIWTSTGTNNIEPPPDVPISCYICGKTNKYEVEIWVA